MVAKRENEKTKKKRKAREAAAAAAAAAEAERLLSELNGPPTAYRINDPYRA